ncbi:SMI1/KNR4 family protein [Pseudothauera nasutitermitis]|uniref:SMI1/KNR4 family protein n=1 Tax=Pseudothauera nasutitermitis TaxID=2565930 RepID=A0A4S4B1W0_9RHOO|nr:SMI1/KNR4 family protein [Pseudothauera nasutitermitis]THF66564.1 SMI1/KNR4 family protein [Pseudothauera nasutitermitis]
MLKNSGPSISMEQINDLEKKLDFGLPKDYKEFILCHNGGVPPADRNIIDIPNFNESPVDVQVFFGINQSINSSNIEWNLKLMKERFPDRKLIPIACDSGGNLFCFRAMEDKTQGIVYCDLEGHEGKEFVVASSFMEFLEIIRPWTDIPQTHTRH